MSNDTINTVVDKKAHEQVNQLANDLKEARLNLVEFLKVAEGANLSKLKVPSDVDKHIKKNSSAVKEFNASQQKTLEIQKKLEASERALALAQSKANRELQANRLATQQLNKAEKDRARTSSILGGEYKRQSAILTQLRNKYKDVALTMGENSKEAQKLQREVTQLDNKLKKVDASVGQHQRSVGNYASAWGGLKNVIMSAVAAFGIYEAINIGKRIYAQVKEINALNNALKQVTENQSAYNQALEFVVGVADRAGAEINTLQKAYTKFYASAKETNLTLEETQEIFETIATVGGVMALSTEEINGALRAMEQMLSKGKIQAEEIRGQMGERLPGAFQILAKSMGITTQQLNKQLELGTVIAEEVLPGMAREYAKVYGLDTIKKVETLVASEQRLGNEWNLFVRDLEKGNGFISRVLMGTFDALSAKLRQTKEDTSELGTEIGQVGRAFQDTVDDIGRVTGETENLTKALGKVGDVLVFLKGLLTISIFEAWAEIIKGVRVSFESVTSAFKKTTDIGMELAKFLKDGDLAGAYDLVKDANKSIAASFNNEWETAYSSVQSNIEKIQKEIDVFIAKNGSLAPLAKDKGYWDFLKIPVPEDETTTTPPSGEPTQRAKVSGLDINENSFKNIEYSVSWFERLIKAAKEAQSQASRGSEEWKKYADEIERLEGIVENIKLGVKIEIEDSTDDLEAHLNKKIPEAMKYLSSVLGEDMTALMMEFKSHYEQDYDNFLEFSKLKMEQAKVEADARQEFMTIATEYAQDALWSAFDIFAAVSDAKIDKIDEEIQASNEMYDAILSNEQLSAKQKKSIENEKIEEEKRLQKEKEKVQKKAFLIEQGVRLAQIAIDTIQKVGAIKMTAAVLAANPLTLPAVPFALAQIPFVIGAGALAAGAVAAQAIPKFKDGHLEGTHEGFAEINDANGGDYKEVLERKDGTILLPQDRNVVVGMQKGDKVHKNYNSFFKEKGYDDVIRASLLTSISNQNNTLNSYDLENVFDKHLKETREEMKRGVQDAMSSWKFPKQKSQDMEKTLKNMMKANV